MDYIISPAQRSLARYSTTLARSRRERGTPSAQDLQWGKSISENYKDGAASLAGRKSIVPRDFSLKITVTAGKSAPFSTPTDLLPPFSECCSHACSCSIVRLHKIKRMLHTRWQMKLSGVVLDAPYGDEQRPTSTHFRQQCFLRPRCKEKRYSHKKELIAREKPLQLT